MTIGDGVQVWIVTDQGQSSSIGAKAGHLVRALRSLTPSVELLSFHYRYGGHPDGSRPVSVSYAKTQSQIPLASWRNRAAVRSWTRSHPGVYHFVGADYLPVRTADRSVITLHEWYFSPPPLRLGVGPFISELAYNANLLVLMQVIPECAEVVVPSLATASQVRKLFGRDPQVIHHAIEKSRFHPRDRRLAREALRLPVDQRLLLNVSGSGPNKNLKTLKELARRLPEGFKLVKLGWPIKAPNVISIRHSNEVDYPLYYAAADMYVHTSTVEGFGQPLIEALGSGIPVVSPACSTGEEILGRNPLLVDDPLDAVEFLDRIRLLDDSTTYESMVGYATRRAKLFDEREWAKKYLTLYQRLGGAPSGE